MFWLKQAVLSRFRHYVHRLVAWAYYENEEEVRKRVEEQRAKIRERERERVEVGGDSRRDRPLTAEDFNSWMNL